MMFISILIMTVLGAFAGFFLKKSTDGDSFLSILFSKYFYFGVILYVLAAILNIYVLRFLPYSVVLPLTAITYIWTMLIAYFLLKESISAKKKIGIVLIVIGAVCVSL
ncbi:DMT family transporter [Sporolactobacillus sp. CPB3-1]|uniref:DMT family transporter n=1 Tax=Sporolactobacillus mangiferae TaxID=2940498 RepID=A0ABT0MAN2_9BACL|nr:DMT family transporter [Sporolactobacillus mangiferae]MCL1631648.1 DMT family transporter [Sporolactobacillus mangiferae]